VTIGYVLASLVTPIAVLSSQRNTGSTCSWYLWRRNSRLFQTIARQRPQAQIGADANIHDRAGLPSGSRDVCRSISEGE
jgi:hypothetical protein